MLYHIKKICLLLFLKVATLLFLTEAVTFYYLLHSTNIALLYILTNKIFSSTFLFKITDPDV